MTKRAVLYARVSSDDTGNEGRNLAGQLTMCRQYAVKKGWQVVAELAEDERGVSGARWDAPQLTQALEMARAGAYDVLVVRELDRFARNLAKQLVIEEELKRYGVRVAYVLEEYGDTPEGRLNKHIRGTIAEYEREKIKQRMERGRWREVERGSVIAHNKPPFGYDLIHDGDKYKLIINKAEAQVIRLIFAMYTGTSGQQLTGTRDILRYLNEVGAAAPAGPGRWSLSTLHYVLTNETYAGTWRYGKKSTRGTAAYDELPTIAVPAIIAPDLWARVQEQRAANKKRPPNKVYDYLVSGMVTCGHCGGAMTAYSTTRSARHTRHYRYYRCNNAYSMGKSCQQGAGFPVEAVDGEIWAAVRDFLNDPGRVRDNLATYQEEQAASLEPFRQRLAVIDSLLAANGDKLTRLLDLYLSGEFDKDLLIERKQRLETAIAALEAERGHTIEAINSALSADDLAELAELAELAAQGLAIAEDDLAMRRLVVEKLGLEVVLTIVDGKKQVSGRCKLVPDLLVGESNHIRNAG